MRRFFLTMRIAYLKHNIKVWDKELKMAGTFSGITIRQEQDQRRLELAQLEYEYEIL